LKCRWKSTSAHRENKFISNLVEIPRTSSLGDILPLGFGVGVLKTCAACPKIT